MLAVAAVLRFSPRRSARSRTATSAARSSPHARGRPAHPALLGSVAAFALRRLLRPLAGWAAGITAYFLLIGLIARSMTTFLTDNPLFADMAAQTGFAELGSVAGYAATLFALLAVALGVFVAARIAALARTRPPGG